jgi:hypothetical protein
MARIAKLTAVLITTTALLALPALASNQVPFRGTMVGLTTSSEFIDPTHLLETVSMSGQATQLGSYTGGGTVETDLSNLTTVGHFILTAANGDTLSVFMTGQATPTATPGIVGLVEQRTFFGGTGRFAGAYGEAIATGQINLNTGIAIARTCGRPLRSMRRSTRTASRLKSRSATQRGNC